MKKLLPLMLLLSACQPAAERAIYQSDAYTLYPDKVVQGSYAATVVSPTEIRSDYQSPASATFPRLIPFKFSINEKDNELPVGQDHWVLIDDEHRSPLVTFGDMPDPMPEAGDTFLPPNYEYTFRVDVSPVLEQFEAQGYYEAFDGSRVAKEDFKGFFIAGGAEPLTWDWVNLGNRGLQLQPTEDPAIYEITLTLNPYEATAEERSWTLTKDLSDRPQYQSDQPLVDALFNLSLEEAIIAIEPDSTFRTGAKWGGVWTRDISYSILLAFAYHEPEVAKISLRKKVQRGRIIQDTGSGGAWPVSSDRTTWALAAWEIYLATGDEAWLAEAYPIIKRSLEDDFRTIYDPETGMYSGESSFLDWREQTYPKWMNNADIYRSQNLGTNAVHYQAHQIVAKMAELLGEDPEPYRSRAAGIKAGVQQHLWQEDRGYFAQFLYGRPQLIVSERFEALGEALAILFDIASPEQAARICAESPLTDYGTTCIYPQIPDIPPYHNNGIWPFVQAYWNLAAAKAGNEAVLTHGLAAIYRAGGLFLTNYENFVAQTGDFEGTEINSHRMLWSMAGNLAMVHRVFMGMEFEPDGLRLQPVVPESFGGTRSLRNFRYRDATLNITVKGFGNRIARATIDGEAVENVFLAADLQGEHEIVIELDNQSFGSEKNLVPNHFSLPAPQVTLDASALRWTAIPGATQYRVYQNGQMIATTESTSHPLAEEAFACWQVSAVDAEGWESFSSEPLYQTIPEIVTRVEMETVAAASGLPYSNFSGEGFVEITRERHRDLRFSVTVPAAGTYLLEMRYANGSGPWNTDNKCAIRTLSVNGVDQGVLVMPQRGQDEWSDWGWSTPIQVELSAGRNDLRVYFADWNENMNVEVNTAMLDYLRLIHIEPAEEEAAG